MPRKPKINLATAKVADGAQKSPTSVYEICGIATTQFKHKSLAEYTRSLRGLNLIELHEEAFKRGVPTNPDRETQIDRLEKRYIQETAQARTSVPSLPRHVVDPDIQAQAEAIMSGRR